MLIQEGKIKRLVLLGATVVIITVMLVVSLFLITTENKNFQSEVQQIEEELINSRKRNIENRLQNLISEINFDQKLMRNLQLSEVKRHLEALHVSLVNQATPPQNNAIKQTLDAFNKDESIHIFALYEDGTIFWNPKEKSSEGENLLHVKDINGKQYIQAMIEVAKSNNDIPVNFTWYEPSKTSIASNLAYVRYLKSKKLIIGAYRSEASIDTWVQETILQKIRTHEFWETSVFFIDKLKSYTMQENFSKPLLHTSKEVYQEVTRSPQAQKALAKSFLKNGFFQMQEISFSYQNQDYLLFSTILPKWRWIIALGENLQELSNMKKSRLLRAKTNRDIKIIQLIVLCLVIAGVFLVLSSYLAQKIEDMLLRYRKLADMEAEKYQALYQNSNDSFVLAKEGDLQILDANSKALCLSGLDLKEMIGMSLELFFPKLDFSHISAHNSGHERTEFLDAQKQIKTVEFSYAWIKIQDQRVIFISIRDISERMRLVKQRREQEQLLIQQSKMAAMGEMLGNIAHQWRQPLSQLSGLFMDIQSAYDFAQLNKKYMDKSVDEANDIIEYMSGTIDDFRNFFNPNKTKERFLVSQALDQAVKIIQSALKYHDIKLDIRLNDEVEIYGYKNEYAQVILNILSNAKDILTQRHIENPKIKINLDCFDNKTHLRIHDNAGGIEEENLSKIFEPYFTTKYQYGTGIGLYMSKMIIEKNMDGQIIAANEDNGASFTIIL